MLELEVEVSQDIIGLAIESGADLFKEWKEIEADTR